MEDQKIVESLKKNRPEPGLKKLYHYYPKFQNWVLAKGGTKADAQDIFQEALIILVRKVSDPNFSLTSKLSTYLFGICKLLWRNELKKKNKSQTPDWNLDLVEAEESDLEEFLKKESKFEKLEKVLQDIGDRCRQLLILFYYRSLSMQEIADNMDFSSAKLAKNQKYKCMERAKKKIMDPS